MSFTKFTRLLVYGYFLKLKADKIVLIAPEGSRKIYDGLLIEGAGKLSFKALWKMIDEGKTLVMKFGKDYTGLGGFQTPLLKQLKVYRSRRKLEIASKILQASLLNKAWLLDRLELFEEADKLREFLDKFASGEKVLDLMGVEAEATRIYYEAIRKVIPKPYVFKGRTRRPPKDHVSAALGLANTWLYNICLEEILLRKLDPRIGVLHVATRDRISLALDIAEEFKPVIVDTVVIGLFKIRGFNIETDFRYKGESVLLSKRGSAKLEKAFKHRLNIKKEGLTLREHIGRQVERFLEAITKDKPYIPFKA